MQPVAAAVDQVRVGDHGSMIGSGPESSYSLADLQQELRVFRDERDWGRFHDPKSLILALVGEVGELSELFQWVPADAARATFSAGARRDRAGQEMADVLIYLLGLADVLDIDVLEAARSKLVESRRRFPVPQVHGTAPVKP